MESRSRVNSSAFLLVTVVLTQLVTTPLFAQSDSQLLRVVIPENMTLEQLRPNRTSTHPQTSGDVLLGTSMWLAQSNRVAGVTVNLRTDTPFVHQLQSSEARDVELRIPGATGWGDWTVDVPIDQTNFSGGDPDAEVRSSSTGPGQCWIPLEVTFITGDATSLVGGTYSLTVTGTISGN